MGKRSHDAVSASEERSASDEHSRSAGPDDHGDHITKSVVIESSDLSDSIMMQCSLPPHATTLHFSSIETFEVHYVKEHTNRCSSCGKNFPSAHFLALHLDELHNPLREALAAKGEKTYGCFLEDCDKKCSNPTKRRLHMIDKHAFPKDYNFRLVQTGIDRTTSLLREGRRRRVSTTSDPPPRHQRRISHAGNPVQANTTTQSQSIASSESPDSQERDVQPHSMPSHPEGAEKIIGPDNQMTQLETSLSALSFIPRTVLSRKEQK